MSGKGRNGVNGKMEKSFPQISENFSIEYVAASLMFFTFVYGLSKIILPLSRSYRLWDKNQQYHARGMVPSSLFIFIIVPLSVWTLFNDDDLKNTRVLGSTAWSRFVIHMATGYFVYDSFVVLAHIKLDGMQYLAHGVLCLITYGLAAMFDCYNYYGPTFLIFEFTTVFVNFRWCLVQLGMRENPVYWWNGLFLMLSWFGVRIVFGLTMSWFFWRDTLNNSSLIPVPIMLWYTFSNVCLNGLNILWFAKIMKGILFHVSGKKHGKDD